MTIEPTDVSSVTDDLTDFENEFFEIKPVEKEVKEEPAKEPLEDEDEPEVVAEPEDSLDEDEPEKPQPKKKNRFQERIDKLKAEAREAQEALEALRAEKAKPPEKTTPAPQKTAATAGEPTPDGDKPAAIG